MRNELNHIFVKNIYVSNKNELMKLQKPDYRDLIIQVNTTIFTIDWSETQM